MGSDRRLDCEHLGDLLQSADFRYQAVDTAAISEIFVPGHKGRTFYAIHTILWLNASFYLAVMLVQIFECVPREKIWNPMISGKCVNLPDTLICGAAINLVSDLSILVVPIKRVWHLQMTLNRKLGISAVFAAGILYVYVLSENLHLLI